MIKKLVEKYLSRKFTQDTAWLLTAQVLLMGAGFGINLLIGHSQGTANLGIFNQALALYMLSATIIGFGLNNTLIKKISESSDLQKQNKILTSTLVTTVVFSIVICAGLVLSTKWFSHLYSSEGLANAVIYPFCTLPLFCINKNCTSYYSGLRRQRLNAFIKAGRWVLLIGMIGLLSFFNADIGTCLKALLAVEFCILLFNMYKIGPSLNWQIDMNLIQSNLSFGSKSFVSELIGAFYQHFDMLLLGYLLTKSEVGIYSFMIFFVKTLYFFPAIVQQNLNPIVSDLWANKQFALLQSHINKIRKVNLVIVTFQALALLLSYKLTMVFMKQELTGSYYYFLICILGAFIFSTISWSGTMLVMAGKLLPNILQKVLIMVFSGLLMYGMATQLGLFGASCAFAVSALLNALLTVNFVGKLLGIKFFS